MKPAWNKILFGLALLMLSILSLSSAAQVAVTTHHNDNSRTGQNLQETTLNTSNVNVSNFGKLFSRTVDGYIYAQPLYLPNLSMGGKTRNVVFVATEHNSLYAFDADDPAASVPLWKVNLGTPVPSQDVCTSGTSGCPYTDLIPEIGITATPAIDTSGGTIYVIAKTKNISNSTYHFFLHALDLLTGVEKFGGPVEIKATGLTPLNQNNRPGLLLLNGVVYAAFGSVGDYHSWHGFVIGYNSSTLTQVAVFNVTPNGKSGGVWAGGQGLLADADSVYFMTGNGTFDVNTGGVDYGDSVLKLSTSSGLHVADYFTPDNQSFLFSNDVDLGSGGPLALPGTSLIVGVGKDGTVRLIDSANMGGFNSLTNNDLQEFHAVSGNCNGSTGLCFMGAPVYWDGPTFGPTIYLWGAGDYLKAFKFNGQTFQTTPVSQATVLSPNGEANTAPLSISANGGQTGTGIVWASGPTSGDAVEATQPGALHAFDASNLTHELWNSNQNPSRDSLGNYAKFTPPTVANGKVYMATFSNQLVVYGSNPPPATSIGFVQIAAATPQSTTQTVSVAYPAQQIAGDLNVIVVGWNDSTSNVQSVADNRGNTYSLAVGPVRTTGLSQSIYYAKNIAGGSNTVTVTFNQAAVIPDIRVTEYAGADQTAPLDVTASHAGTGTAASTGSATTTAANDLLFGANTVATGNKAPGAGFTTRIITSPDSDLVEDATAPSPGGYAASATLTQSGAWVMQLAAFKLGRSSGGTSPTVASVSPTSGPAAGGTSVTISGTSFASGATVSFGGAAASNVAVTSSTAITATTPAHTAGTVNVVVTNPDGQSGTLTNGFTYTSSVSSISFVQVAAATPQSLISTVAVSYPHPQLAGNMNIVVVGWNDAASTVQSVSDSLGNIYNLAIGPTTGTALRQAIYYAPNIKAGGNTVTVNFNQAASYPDIRILEYSGLNSTSPLDVATGAVGKSSTASSGAATTRFATELLFAADTVYTGNKGAGMGFTVRVITSPDSDLAEDAIVSTTGNYTATAPLTAIGNWVMQMATFKAAGQ